MTHSAISFGGILNHPTYCQLPVSYLVCEEDQAVSVQAQEAAIARIQEASSQKVDIYTCKAGHFPAVSRPADVVRVIRQTAGESLG
jgi:surfactin synthase thioesterase subunit